jgi:hypothetical protein
MPHGGVAGYPQEITVMAGKTKEQRQRSELYDRIKATLPSATAADIEKVIDSLMEAGTLFGQAKDTSRTKTFRFPAEILDWLEAQAASKSRSPNAELIEVLRNAKANT